jgi:signal transduction histidine kinase
LSNGILSANMILMSPRNSHGIGLETPEVGPDSERLEKISHDFRTPLNIIIGFTELLMNEIPGKINDEQRRSLSDILNGARRLLSLVDETFKPSSPY